ncbi:hypothetical protein ACLB2K_011499 [Fragaria x ananassa]
MSRVGHNSSSHKARNVHKQTRDDPTSKGEDQLSLDILSCHFYKVGRSWDDMEAYQLKRRHTKGSERRSGPPCSPVENHVLEVLAEEELVALEVPLQRQHHDGDVGDEDDGEAEEEVEPHGGDSASGVKLDGAFGAEVEEVGVGVLGVGGAQPLANLTRTKEQGQTVVPMWRVPSSCWKKTDEFHKILHLLTR